MKAFVFYIFLISLFCGMQKNSFANTNLNKLFKISKQKIEPKYCLKTNTENKNLIILEETDFEEDLIGNNILNKQTNYKYLAYNNYLYYSLSEDYKLYLINFYLKNLSASTSLYAKSSHIYITTKVFRI